MYNFKEILAAWEQVKEAFRREISGVSVDLWFGSIKLIGCKNNLLHMEMESQALYKIVMANYFERLRQKFKDFLDPDFEIELECTGHVVTAADILRQMGYVKRPIGSAKDFEAVEGDSEYIHVITTKDNEKYVLEKIEGFQEEYEVGEPFESEKLGNVSRQKSESDDSYSLHRGYVDPYREMDPFGPHVKNPTQEDIDKSNFEHTFNLNHFREEPSESDGESDANGMPKYDFQYTFENFIVGNSNKFAHAACVAVAEHPARNYNPLFIYGPSGLGKTHLLNAITNYLKKKNPQINITYVKGEDFTNYMIDCISRQAMKEFRDTYRKCDVLLIDDIQFIAGKESTQEEFFHTFNALYDERKQIILTSDRPPRDIQHLENRLKSRFEWGLLADIQPPDLELRIAIIKTKSESVKLYLTPEILQYLAENLRSNVRQIEGAIKKLGAINFLSGKPISMEDAARCVSELLGDDEPVTVTIDKIFTVVYKKYGITKDELLSSKRNKNIAQARHVAIYLIREITHTSLPSIGTIFNRDHTTVMSSLESIAKKSSADHVFAQELKELKKQVTG